VNVASLSFLLRHLRSSGYRFTTPTPETHRRVIARRNEAHDLRDIFGWNLPFAADLLPPDVRTQIEDLLQPDGARLKSRVRVASLDGHLFVHSAFPTDDPQSVFFGPDSYRFGAFLHAELPKLPPARRLVDMGTGSGVGAIVASALVPDARLTLADINPDALALAAANAHFAGLDVECVHSQGLKGVDGPVDLIIANPPYIADESDRAYRDGGDMHGARLSLDWALEAATRLGQGGHMLLYTGSAMVAGRDALREALEAELPPLGCNLRYWEIDPDVFGEELDTPAYREVERIAVVGAVIAKY
jgi:methylase of polypeptide subunit release factors